MKRYMRRSNRIPMPILSRISSISKRRESETAELPPEIVPPPSGCALSPAAQFRYTNFVSTLKIFFYKFYLT